MLNYAHQFIKIRLVFNTRLISETKPVTPLKLLLLGLPES